MIRFKDLYQVLPEHINVNNMIRTSMSYCLKYEQFEIEVYNNAAQVRSITNDYSYYITTFTNGMMHYKNYSEGWWTIKFNEIQTKEDLFNLSLQKDIYDLDLEIIRYIENLIRVMIDNLYDERSNLIKMG